MASKTPFEIRTDLLNLAQSILFEKTMAERQRLEQDWNTKRDEYFSVINQQGEKKLFPTFPTLPYLTTEDVIAEAKKLNDFVSNG